MTTTGAGRDPVAIEADLWDGWQGALAFDVGGNIGQSVPLLLERFTRVVTLEPAAESWAVLESVIHPALVKLAVAVSDCDGYVVLWEQPGNIEQGQLISEGHHAFGRLPGPKTARTVPCRTLDTLAGDHGIPDLVKIDTEGHELRILHGAANLLAKAATGWLIEFHSRALADGCLRVLDHAGYDPQVIRHPHYTLDNSDYHDHGWIRAEAPRHG